MTNVIRSTDMAEKAISVRLDVEAQRALARLTTGGASQSHAIRQALIEAARTSLLEQARLDAEQVGNDPADRAVIAEISAFFDEFAPTG
jgi:Arc/MetJ-type ribon-helix-helix transcriptional regulator